MIRDLIRGDGLADDSAPEPVPDCSKLVLANVLVESLIADGGG